MRPKRRQWKPLLVAIGLGMLAGGRVSADLPSADALFDALQRKTGDTVETDGSVWERAEALWAHADPGVAPVEDLLVPLEHHPDGTVKTILRAESARMPPGGCVRARGVYVESYDENKSLFRIIETDRCIFDSRGNRALGLGKVRLQHRGLRVEGTNVLWISGEQLVKIFVSPEVRIQGEMIDLTPGRNP